MFLEFNGQESISNSIYNYIFSKSSSNIICISKFLTKVKKKKDGGKQLMIFIKEIYGRLMLSGIYIFYATQLVLL